VVATVLFPAEVHFGSFAHACIMIWKSLKPFGSSSSLILSVAEHLSFSTGPGHLHAPASFVHTSSLYFSQMQFVSILQVASLFIFLACLHSAATFKGHPSLNFNASQAFTSVSSQVPFLLFGRYFFDHSVTLTYVFVFPQPVKRLLAPKIVRSYLRQHISFWRARWKQSISSSIGIAFPNASRFTVRTGYLLAAINASTRWLLWTNRKIFERFHQIVFVCPRVFCIPPA